MMLADINGDGKVDACARGVAGIWCELSTRTSFPTRRSSDLTTYGVVAKLDESRYSSLRFADVNGDGKPDICGRGTLGVYCALNNGKGGFGSVEQRDDFFTDANS